MQRGRRNFNQLVDTVNDNKPQSVYKRGRSEALIINRNQCLIYRYYYYSKIKRWRYEDVMNELSKEFFLNTRTILNHMEDQAELVKTIFKEKPLIKELEKKFNFLNWKIKNQ